MSDQAKEAIDSGSKRSADQPAAPSNGKSLSKAAQRLSQPKPKKKDKDPAAASSRPLVQVDVSTNTVEINQGVRIFGTDDEDSTRALLRQVADVTPTYGKHDLQNLKWAVATVHGIAPRDPLEGLLAAQMLGVHNLAMECLRRASVAGQTLEGVDANVSRAVRLLRTFTSQMEALNRHRGKVGQPVVVGNVNVNDGGQAIVGSVSNNGREKSGNDDDAEKR